MGSVRVAIVGVGNCATSLIQGVEYYKDADPAGSVPEPYDALGGHPVTAGGDGLVWLPAYAAWWVVESP